MMLKCNQRYRRYRRFLQAICSWCLALCSGLCLAANQAQDIPNSADLPEISRYPGSIIIDYHRNDYNEAIFPLGVNSSKTAKEFAHDLAAGENITITYTVPRNVTNSPLKVFRSFEQALDRAGFTAHISCSGEKKACGYFFYRQFIDQPSRARHYRRLPNHTNLYNQNFFLYTGSATKNGKSVRLILTVATVADKLYVVIDLVREAELVVAPISVDLPAESLKFADDSNDFQHKDKEGLQDLALLARFPGSYILDRQENDFAEAQYPMAPNTQSQPKEFQALSVSGKITTLIYQIPKTVTTSTTKVFRSYENALVRAGFKTDLSCSGEKKTCGYFFHRAFINTHSRKKHYQNLLLYTNFNTQDFYLYTGRLRRGSKTIYALITVAKLNDEIQYALDIIEEQSLITEEVTVSLETLAQDIRDTGKAVLGGLYFDHNSKNLLPTSESALKVIATFLGQQAENKFLVVGHTDNVGGFNFNENLSLGRALSVTKTLIDTYNIPAQQLKPYGVAFAAPVMSNATEAGRARNRRVELILIGSEK